MAQTLLQRWLTTIKGVLLMHIHPIHTATVIGVDDHLIRVEVDLPRRLPSISIVGLLLTVQFVKVPIASALPFKF